MATRTAQRRPLEPPNGGLSICPCDKFSYLPLAASVSRMDSPEVSIRCAWCMRRATVELAMVLA